MNDLGPTWVGDPYEGELPAYVNRAVAASAEDALTYAESVGAVYEEDVTIENVKPVLMRRLDPIAAKIRYGDEDIEWWVECTARAKAAVEFWRLG